MKQILLKNIFFYFVFFISCIGRIEATFPFDLEKIKIHINQKFSECTLETEPFPHIIIRDILPADVYTYLTSHWPDEKLFDKNSRERRRLPVTQGCANKRLPNPEQRELWQTFGEVIMNQYIQDHVKRLFLPLLSQKLPFLSQERFNWVRENIAFAHSHSDGLNLDQRQYSILPHIDQAYIFAAMILYFPTDSDHPEYGTTFYKPLKNETAIDIRYLKRNQCKAVKTAPFLPNTILIYLQNPHGWHGVEPLKDPSYARKAYLALLNLDYDLVEKIYGSKLYKGKELYAGELRYLDPKNYQKF